MTGSRPLNEFEIQAILSACDSTRQQAFTGKYELRNRTLFLLGLNTGARISELLSLNVEDVWRYNRPVDIIYFQKRHTKGKLVGRQITIKSGAQQAIFELIQWKRGVSARGAMNYRFADSLRSSRCEAFRELTFRAQEGESLAKDAPLFVSRQAGRLKRKQAHNIFRDAFDACELPGQVTTHSLRKTFANYALRASGGNLKVLQELLGHKHLSTTSVYLSAGEEELRSAVPDFYELDKSYVSSNSKVISMPQPAQEQARTKHRKQQ